jgi:hypothetical protein
LDLVGCCPIVAGCEGAAITIQPSRPPKYRSAADAILCLRVIKDEVTAVHDLVRKKNRISKQFVLRKIKRYRSVIQSENYKTW